MFVVTGGGSGIGQALAHELAIRKKPVLIVGRREHRLREVASFSPLIQYVCADVSTVDGREHLASCLKSQAKIEGLIHNAGLVDPIAPITSIDETAFRQAMATHIDAPLFLTQLLYHTLTDGRVLHIGSGAAYFPVVGWASYCVSKAGLSMLTRCWQLESHEVAFASVMPGIIDTDMQAVIRQASDMDPKKQHFFHDLFQQKKLLSPATVAVFLSWLLLDIDTTRYVSQEWDIYDETHHPEWLFPPHAVPSWESIAK